MAERAVQLPTHRPPPTAHAPHARSGPAPARPAVELASARRLGAPVDQIDDLALGLARNRRMRRVHKAREAFGEPMVAPRLPAVPVHPLLDDSPVAVVGHDEAVQVEVEPVLHRWPVDLRNEPARRGECGAVEANPRADVAEFMRCPTRVLWLRYRCARPSEKDDPHWPLLATGEAQVLLDVQNGARMAIQRPETACHLLTTRRAVLYNGLRVARNSPVSLSSADHRANRRSAEGASRRALTRCARWRRYSKPRITQHRIHATKRPATLLLARARAKNFTAPSVTAPCRDHRIPVPPQPDIQRLGD